MAWDRELRIDMEAASRVSMSGRPHGLLVVYWEKTWPPWPQMLAHPGRGMHRYFLTDPCEMETCFKI